MADSETGTREAAAELRLTPGDRVWFSVKALEVALYPAPHRQTGETS